MSSYFSEVWKPDEKKLTITFDGGDSPGYANIFAKSGNTYQITYTLQDSNSQSSSSPITSNLIILTPVKPSFTGISGSTLPNVSIMPGTAATYNCPVIIPGDLAYS